VVVVNPSARGGGMGGISLDCGGVRRIFVVL